MPNYHPHIRRSIGSSYFIQQSPGAEQVGGLEVILKVPAKPPGRIVVENTLYHSSETRDDLGVYASEAIRGLLAFAGEHGLDLSTFDITLGHFFIHDVDSRPALYFLTAQYAFQSALATWTSQVTPRQE